MIKICEYCNKEFKTPNSKRKYCGRECSAKSTIVNIDRKCLVCGITFTPSHRGTVYCSNTCKFMFKRVEKNRCTYCGSTLITGSLYCSYTCYNKSRERKHKLCLYCNKEFICLDKPTQKFCSQKCMGMYNRVEPKPLKGKLKKQYLSTTCKQCGKTFEFYSKDANAKTRKFCSKSCSSKSTRLIQPFSIISLCSCGCGGVILNPTNEGNYRKYIPGHKFFGKRGGPTSLEVELYNYLEKVGVPFEKQKRIGITTPDAYIPPLNLCIYADGSYWHNRPKTIKSDRKCEKFLTDNNYLWIRLPDINKKNLDLKPLKQHLLQNLKTVMP